MPGAVNVAIRWRRAGGSATVAAGIGNASAAGLQAAVTAPSAPAITSPAFLVAGTVNTVYPSTTFTASGSTPITWSYTGTLPTGMAFSSAGVLSGTPTATASGSITFTATNALGADSRALTLTVNAAGAGPVLVTAPVIETGRSTSQEVTLQILTPAVWVNDMPTFASPGYAIQRRFQWQADGIDITNAIGTVYSPGRGYAGKSIRCKETSWFLDTPASTNVTYSNTIQAPSAGAYALDIVYHDDIEWLGAFKFPSTGRPVPFNFAFGGRGVGFDASGDSGAGSLFAMGNSNGFFAGEIRIPAVSKSNLTYSSLPTSTLLASSDDIFNGRSSTVGISGFSEVAGIFPNSSGKLVFTLHNTYPGSPNLAYMFRRPRDLTSGVEIEGPFRVTDPNRDAPRSGSGYLSALPSSLHSSLGGSHLHGLIPDSGAAYPASSNGPSLNSFNLADLNTATTRAFKFDVVAATANTVDLPSPASTTPGAYVGNYVQLIPIGSAPSVPILITAYDGVNRRATLTSNWSSTPSAGAKAQLIAQVQSKALANYDLSPFGLNTNGWAVVNRVFDPSVNIFGAFVPDGTRSALLWGDHGAGIYQYTNNESSWQQQAGTLAISNVVAVNSERWTCTISVVSGSLQSNHVIAQGNNLFFQVGNVGSTYTLNVYNGGSGQFGTLGPVLGEQGAPVSGSALFTLNYTWPFFAYDPIGASTGEHSYPYHLKLWTYNTDDLAAVKNGTLPLQSIRPTQMFQFKLPVGNDPDLGRIRGAAYDPATKRAYVSVGNASGSGTDDPVIHVFRINNAVAV